MDISGQEFENEVRRVARLLWKDAEFSGAEMLDERERDGVFETRDTINVIECTISSKKDKAAEDGKKTAELVQKFRRSSLTCSPISRRS